MLTFAGMGGLTLFVPTAGVSAANVAVEQCNGVSNSGGLTVQCNVMVVNNLTDDPSTTGSMVTMNGASVESPDIVTSINQCNGSANGGGGTMLCTVTVVNNISVSGASGSTGATVNQCNDNQPDGLGTAPNVCTPYPAGTSGATITQCDGTGNGGGLVSPSGCTASGSVSAALSVTINQCNGSAKRGREQSCLLVLDGDQDRDPDRRHSRCDRSCRRAGGSGCFGSSGRSGRSGRFHRPWCTHTHRDASPGSTCRPRIARRADVDPGGSAVAAHGLETRAGGIDDEESGGPRGLTAVVPSLATGYM